MAINKCRKNVENKKSLLEHHSYNCFRQEPLMNAKISGQALRRNK